MKKSLLITLMVLTTTMVAACSSDKSEQISITSYNITHYFDVDIDMYGDAATFKPCVTLWSLDSSSYVKELSITMTIEYNVSYYCNRYLGSCDEFNNTNFEARFSITGEGKMTPLIQNRIDRDSLPNVCAHGINHDTVRIVDYRIVSASGYYVKVKW